MTGQTTSTHWRIQLEGKPSSMIVSGYDLKPLVDTAEAMGAEIRELLTTKQNGLWEVKMTWKNNL